MATATTKPAADLKAAAASVAQHYRTASPRETETAVALLVLWTLDALDGGRITPDDATEIITSVWVSVVDAPPGPDLSDATHELLEESTWLHDEAIGEGADPGQLRTLAHMVLNAAGPRPPA